MEKRTINVSTVLVVVVGVLCVMFTILDTCTISKDKYYKKVSQNYVIIEENKDNDDMLVYDKETYIVYKCKKDREGIGLFNDNYIIEPCFASNGLPYRYNENLQKIEIIDE